MHSMDYNYKDSILLFQLSLLVSHCIGSLIPHRSSRKHKPMQQSCEVSSFTSWPLVLLLGLQCTNSQTARPVMSEPRQVELQTNSGKLPSDQTRGDISMQFPAVSAIHQLQACTFCNFKIDYIDLCVRYELLIGTKMGLINIKSG